MPENETDLSLASPPGMSTGEPADTDLESLGEDAEDTGTDGGTKEAEKQGAESEDNSIRLDKTNFSGEISRLMREQPEFKQAFDSHVGQKAKTRFDPLLAAKDVEISRLQDQVRTAEISGMKPEDVQSKFDSDPEFAREYARLVHPDGSANQAVELANMRAAFSALMDTAMEQGLPPEQVKEIEENATKGEYEVDSSGTKLPRWSQQMPLVQADIYSRLAKLRQAPADDKADKTEANKSSDGGSNDKVAATKPEAKTDARPDMSGGSSRGASQAVYTKAQVDAMNPAELLEAFPGEGDFEKAARAGKIEGLSAETLEVFQT